MDTGNGLAVFGVNHKCAPIELRERLAIEGRDVGAALEAASQATGCQEVLILSTCNRLELYGVMEEQVDLRQRVLRFLADRSRRSTDELAAVLYQHEGGSAVRHLFEVASGLDSLVVGETQIMAQVKAAYAAAKESGRTGRVLNHVFQRALAVAKRVHTETAIGERSVSVPSVAAKLATKIFQELANRHVLIVGAGEMGELTLEAFRERGVREITVVSRNVDHAKALARKIGGTGLGLEQLQAVLPRADVVIACLTVERPILGREEVERALRERRREPMFFIDIAVPRNIEGEINGLENIYLYNIDDLQGIVDRNLAERRRVFAECAPLLASETEACLAELASRDIQGVINRLRSTLETVGDEELNRTLARLPNARPEDREEVRTLVHRIINKVLHHPTTALKEEAMNGQQASLVDLVARLFKLK